jgi:quercetin dioxygenase-like cupin family protein
MFQQMKIEVDASLAARRGIRPHAVSRARRQQEKSMELNADFKQRAVVHAATLAWTASPMPGVDRRMLDRIGGEVARATSIVRYAPGSRFSPHVHDGGEEFLVLAGVFQDEHGDYPAGSYVRNPPTSRHTPGSMPGCVLLVKLWQFDPDDRRGVRLDTTTMNFQPAPDRPGVEILPLFQDLREDVRLERWAPQAAIRLHAPRGLELLVLEGGFVETEQDFCEQSWLRLPAGATLQATTGSAGCRAWIKTDHLVQVNYSHIRQDKEAAGRE